MLASDNAWQCIFTLCQPVILRPSISSLETPLRMRGTFNGFLTRRVPAGRYVTEGGTSEFLHLLVQRWIGADAASQVEHMSGSYSVIVSEMNLRYDLCHMHSKLTNNHIQG
jgi:hypothetical protein